MSTLNAKPLKTFIADRVYDDRVGRVSGEQSNHWQFHFVITAARKADIVPTLRSLGWPESQARTVANAARLFQAGSQTQALIDSGLVNTAVPTVLAYKPSAKDRPIWRAFADGTVLLVNRFDYQDGQVRVIDAA